MLKAMQIVALIIIVIAFLLGLGRLDDFRGIGLWFVAALLIIGIMISEAIKHRKESGD